MINGKHYVAGQWVAGAETFRSSPFRGTGYEFARGNAEAVDDAVTQGVNAFGIYSRTTTAERAKLLNDIAFELDQIKTELITMCCDETGLLEERISGEFTRTVNQLRYFAKHIEQNDPLDSRHDAALPDRTPAPRPELRMFQRPVGPVAVFGASNFPLAFSTAGGDTAAALAAGCSVIVKGHQSHPGTGDLVAQAIERAVKTSGAPRGVFSQIQSDTFEAGQSLVQHPQIKAVGFTGSLAGGRYLFDLCAARAEPIPFFGELGSVNPVFVLPGALKVRAEQLARDWVASLTFGSGQLCTNPGIVVMQSGPEAEQFIKLASQCAGDIGPQAMLSDPIAEAFRSGHEKIRDCTGTTMVNQSSTSRRTVTPAIFVTNATTWLNNQVLREEVFGPLGQVVTTSTPEEYEKIANQLEGQLTCTVHTEDSDSSIAAKLLPLLESKAGRIIFNGFPTGVEVCDSMVHGGPYPASTNFGATSVGSLSIRRFLRPVCYQNVPAQIMATLMPLPNTVLRANSSQPAVSGSPPAGNGASRSSQWYKADSRNR